MAGRGQAASSTTIRPTPAVASVLGRRTAEVPSGLNLTDTTVGTTATAATAADGGGDGGGSASAGGGGDGDSGDDGDGVGADRDRDPRAVTGRLGSASADGRGDGDRKTTISPAPPAEFALCRAGEVRESAVGWTRDAPHVRPLRPFATSSPLRALQSVHRRRLAFTTLALNTADAAAAMPLQSGLIDLDRELAALVAASWSTGRGLRPPPSSVAADRVTTTSGLAGGVAEWLSQVRQQFWWWKERAEALCEEIRLAYTAGSLYIAVVSPHQLHGKSMLLKAFLGAVILPTGELSTSMVRVCLHIFPPAVRQGGVRRCPRCSLVRCAQGSPVRRPPCPHPCLCSGSIVCSFCCRFAVVAAWRCAGIRFRAGTARARGGGTRSSSTASASGTADPPTQRPSFESRGGSLVVRTKSEPLAKWRGLWIESLDDVCHSLNSEIFSHIAGEVLSIFRDVDRPAQSAAPESKGADAFAGTREPLAQLAAAKNFLDQLDHNWRPPPFMMPRRIEPSEL